MNDQVQKFARRVVADFKSKRVLGIEMFVFQDDNILINETTFRPHYSGNYIIEACRISQFDSHLSAILDHPILNKNLQLLRSVIILNILGEADSISHLSFAKVAKAAGAKVHLYGKENANKRRKMRHLTFVGDSDSMPELEKEMRHLIAGADKLHDEQPRRPSLLEDGQPKDSRNSRMTQPPPPQSRNRNPSSISPPAQYQIKQSFTTATEFSTDSPSL